MIEYHVLEEMDVTEDVNRIVCVCKKHDLEVGMREAKKAWVEYSEDFSARWMILPQDNDLLFSSVRNYLPWKDRLKCSKCRKDKVVIGLEFCPKCTKETLDWIQQTVHRSYHDGPLDECRKSVCDVILQIIGAIQKKEEKQ